MEEWLSDWENGNFGNCLLVLFDNCCWCGWPLPLVQLVFYGHAQAATVHANTVAQFQNNNPALGLKFHKPHIPLLFVRFCPSPRTGYKDPKLGKLLPYGDKSDDEDEGYVWCMFRA